jgi:hypothetical protein
MTQLGKGRAAAIAAADIALLADELGCHPADLEAISQVESGGFGWFRDGRIKILFEKHWFYKLVDAPLRATAAKRGLARKSWVSPSKGGYRDQKSADDRYRLLAGAIALDREAALQSVSIGRYQIMGFNYKICGFSSASAMWAKFLESERHQLSGFANFLKSKGLVAAIRRRDFTKVEKVYNGGGLGGAYARRMKAASEQLRAGKWKGYEPGSMTPVQETETSGDGASAQLPKPHPPASPEPRPVPEANEPSQLVRVIIGFLGALARALLGARIRPNWTPDGDESDDDGSSPTHS